MNTKKMVKTARKALTKMFGFEPLSNNGRHAWVISLEANNSNLKKYLIHLGTDPKLPGLFQTGVECCSDDADEKTRQEILKQVEKALAKAFPELYSVEDPTPPSIH